MAGRLSKLNKKCSFQDCWLLDPQFSLWLEKDKSIYSARCKLCHIAIDLSNMGRTALRSHCEKSKKHKDIIAELQHKEVRKVSVFKINSSQPQSSKNNPETEGVSINLSSSNVANDSQCVSTSQSFSNLSTSTSHISNKFPASVKSEIISCLYNVMYHDSLRGTEGFVQLCPIMFPDSRIAAEMRLHKDKISYSVNHDLAPFFKNELKDELLKCQHIAVAFDECLNKVIQKNQMDLCVRFWCPVNYVTTRYYNSAFLGSMTAPDLLDNFKKAVKPIDPKKIIHIGMDGPNVNLKMLKDLKTDFISEYDACPKILEIGSCGLHTVNNAFKGGMEETGWDLKQFLNSSYYLFNNFPSRKAEFIKATSCEKFPLKHCETRWTENSPVAQRALEILPHLKKYVEHIERAKIAPFKSNNFKTLKKFLADSLLPAKLSFMSWLGSEVEPFLTAFQTDAPYIPFLYTSLSTLLSTLLKCFVKQEVLEQNAGVLTKIDLNKNDSLIHAKNVELGLRVKATLGKIDKKTYKDVDILVFRRDVRTCLKTFCSKLFEKSPLKFKLTKALTSLDPKVASNKSVGKARFENLMSILMESDWISAIKGEMALKQYEELQSSKNVLVKLTKYSKKETTVDVFWMGVVKTVDFDTKEFVEILKMCLILFHGNAVVERSFSINKSVLDCNLTAESLVARRIVHDKVSSVGGIITNVEITKPLMSSFILAYSKFKVATRVHDEEIKEIENEKLKRKNFIKRIELLKKQKVDLMTEKSVLEDELNDEIRRLERFVK